MKKNVFLGIILVLILFTNSCVFFVTSEDPTPTPTPIPDGYITIANISDEFIIEYVYIRVAGTTDWGSDWLGVGTIGPGSSQAFTVAPDTYDVQVIDDWADSYSVNNQYVGPGATIILYYDGFSLY